MNKRGFVKNDLRLTLTHNVSVHQCIVVRSCLSFSFQFRRALSVASTPLLDLLSLVLTVGFESRPWARIPGWASRIRQVVSAVWIVACGGCWSCGKARHGRKAVACAPLFVSCVFVQNEARVILIYGMEEQCDPIPICVDIPVHVSRT